ncbi:MAG: MFS transporter [Vicinamibacteria bacterium]|nr:MFS transporter [Vicinamibacteria bacterium]
MRALLRRLLVNRRVAFLWIGQVVSQAGDSVYQIGLLWLILDMTGRTSLAGLAAAALFLPTLIFGLAAGVVADRVSRRRLMILMDALRAALVLAVPLGHRLDWLGPSFLGALTFAVASCAAFFNPARDALVPSLAEPDELPHANALMQTSWQLAILLGPALAGVLLSITGLIHLFTFDALTYLASLVAIVAVGGSRGRRVSTPARVSALRELRDGLAYVARDPLMRIIVIVTAVDNLILMGPAIVGPPILVRETLGIDDPRAYAWAQAALAGGMLVGAPFMATWGRRLPLGRTLLWGVVLDGLTYTPLFFVDSLAGVVGVIFVHSFFVPLITVSRTTLIQRHAPARLHGRVFAAIGVCVVGGTALSAAMTGIAAETFEMRAIFLVIGLAAAATALPGFASRAIRQADGGRETRPSISERPFQSS